MTKDTLNFLLAENARADERLAQLQEKLAMRCAEEDRLRKLLIQETKKRDFLLEEARLLQAELDSLKQPGLHKD